MSSGLCKYKDIFGKPKQGVHSYRLFGLAIVDVVFTFIFAWLLTMIIPKQPNGKRVNVILVFLVLMGLSVFIHRAFCVETTLTKLVFGPIN